MCNNHQFFDNLFLKNTPLLDVRSPSEFEHGHFPTSTNIPVLDNEQRKQVGTCYKHNGADEAERLGHYLVSGKVLAKRGSAWLNFFKKNPAGYLYCARGGMRSQKVCHWLKSEGVICSLVPSGYKAMRRHLLDTLDAVRENFEFIIVSGSTGSGKTHFINSLTCPVIDLEGLANHRGSSFGKRIGTQPSQVSFENKLAIALIRAKSAGARHVIIEDESKLIGRCCLPVVFQQIISVSPVLVIDESLESRVQAIFDDYIAHDLNQWYATHGEKTGMELFAISLHDNLDRIAKRLGGERYNEISALMSQAVSACRKGEKLDAFYPVIEKLLVYYYDPMYQYQMLSKKRKVLALGTKSEIKNWIYAQLNR